MKLQTLVRSWYDKDFAMRLWRQSVFIYTDSGGIPRLVVEPGEAVLAYYDKKQDLFILSRRYYKGENRIIRPLLWKALIEMAPDNAIWDTEDRPKDKTMRRALLESAKKQWFEKYKEEIARLDRRYNKLKAQADEARKICERIAPYDPGYPRADSNYQAIRYKVAGCWDELWSLSNPSEFDLLPPKLVKKKKKISAARLQAQYIGMQDYRVSIDDSTFA